MIKTVLCKCKYANEGSRVSATIFISITPWIWSWSQSLNGLIWIYQFEQHWWEQYLTRLFQRQSIVVPSLSEPLMLWRRWNEINTCELQRTVPTLSCPPSLSCHHPGHHHHHQRGKGELACAENLANNIHSTMNTFPLISVVVNVKVRLHVLLSFVINLFNQKLTEQLQTPRTLPSTERTTGNLVDMATILVGSPGCGETGNKQTTM